ncbi:MAG TPA: SIS domain-containing protein [Candidatus Omnitrophota bacterium]|nr:SIS domain-containing protein [Candidatus Omnitrophota bacterium]
MPKKYARKYLDDLIKSLDSLPLEKVEEVAEVMKDAYRKGRRIFAMGNGGSAATASHFVCDFAKGSGLPGKKKFKAVSLTDNVALLTAWGNDVSYDDIFSAQLEPLLEKDDVVVVFSGSGNSKNILKAVEFANGAGAKTVAFTGFKGGKVAGLAKLSIVVPSDNMERIEDIHLILEHLLHLYLLEEIREGRL